MSDSIVKKKEHLYKLIENYQSLVVAFSGGVDSTLILALAQEILKEKVIAVTITSPLQALKEREQAISLVRHFNVSYVTIDINFLADESIVQNTKTRCYTCKKRMFKEMKAMAKSLGFNAIVDGSNADDLNDTRPGLLATKEMEIRSPFVESYITKSDIRKISKTMNLPTWNKPPMACLATRIPYYLKITPTKLRQIESAESVLTSLGFEGFRVRHFDKIAKIEVSPQDIERVVDMEIRKILINEFKAIGFLYITLDIEGYRQGSMNM
ncbi:MAG: ATP-dependent sacrificial sulfur transferase LarE [Desulfobacterales bacterium]|nr:ATP-dependent sacrificial sulfur transferase LarE [Desulfobacterales bacterium]